MRNVFVSTLIEIAKKDERIILLTGDLGYSVLEPFIEQFPLRFFNVGVAEQNMIGLATGLAEAGFIPFVYSIATFASLRPYEFIRNGPILHKLPVRIIGIGGGFEYGHAGMTHHALEDIGIMRIQPGIKVIVPADHKQARNALLATWDSPGPIYYRIGKDNKNVIKGLKGQFTLGRAQVIGKGKDCLIITTGSIADEAQSAIEVLTAKGIDVTMMVVASITPSPLNDIIKALSRFSTVFTVEAHYAIGGLGSMVSEIAAERKFPCQVIRCGVKTAIDGISGDTLYLNHKYNLSAEAIADTVYKFLQKNPINKKTVKERKK